MSEAILFDYVLQNNVKHLFWNFLSKAAVKGRRYCRRTPKSA